MLIPPYIKDIASCFFLFTLFQERSLLFTPVCVHMQHSPRGQTEHCTAALKMFVTGPLDADSSRQFSLPSLPSCSPRPSLFLCDSLPNHSTAQGTLSCHPWLRPRVGNQRTREYSPKKARPYFYTQKHLKCHNFRCLDPSAETNVNKQDKVPPLGWRKLSAVGENRLTGPEGKDFTIAIMKMFKDLN